MYMTFIQHIAKSAAKQRRIITLNYVQIKVSLINYFLLGPEPDTQKNIHKNIARNSKSAHKRTDLATFSLEKGKISFPLFIP